MARVHLGLGTNLGDRAANLRAAIARIEAAGSGLPTAFRRV